MKRTLIVVGTLVLGAGAVMAQQEIAVQQDNLMRSQAKSMYGVILKMTKGDIPYDQKAVDDAIASLETDVAKIAKTFEVNPKQDVVGMIGHLFGDVIGGHIGHPCLDPAWTRP